MEPRLGAGEEIAVREGAHRSAGRGPKVGRACVRGARRGPGPGQGRIPGGRVIAGGGHAEAGPQGAFPGGGGGGFGGISSGKGIEGTGASLGVSGVWVAGGGPWGAWAWRLGARGARGEDEGVGDDGCNKMRRRVLARSLAQQTGWSRAQGLPGGAGGRGGAGCGARGRGQCRAGALRKGQGPRRRFGSCTGGGGPAVERGPPRAASIKHEGRFRGRGRGRVGRAAAACAVPVTTWRAGVEVRQGGWGDTLQGLGVMRGSNGCRAGPSGGTWVRRERGAGNRALTGMGGGARAPLSGGWESASEPAPRAAAVAAGRGRR
jgi:hypothetical protein